MFYCLNKVFMQIVSFQGQTKERFPVKASSYSRISLSTMKIDLSVLWQQIDSFQLRQICASLGPLILTISLGMTFGYSAILLPWLRTNNVTLSSDRASWIASSAVLPLPFGSLLGGYLMATIGRKTSHLLATIPCIFGWLLCNYTEFSYLLTGRFLTGLGGGILGTCTGPYLSEISSLKLRHFLLGCLSLGVALGLFLVHLIGTFDVGSTAWFCMATVIVGGVLSLWIPESPAWLVTKNEIPQAEKNFRWLRGDDERARGDLAQLTAANCKSNEVTDVKKEFLVPLGIVGVFLAVNQWSGVNSLTFYAVLIMKNSLGQQNVLHENMAMLIVDFFRLIMSVIACVLMKKCSKRSLSICSGVGTTFSLLSLSLYIFVSRNYDILGTTVVPMVCLVAYITFVTIGFVPIPWALMGEMFPMQWRSLGSGLASFVAFSAFFSVVKTGPLLIENVGMDGTFLIYGCVAGSGTIFLYFLLPK